MAAPKIETYKGWTLRSKRVGVHGAYGGLAWPGNEDAEMEVPLEDFVAAGNYIGKGAQKRVLGRLKEKIDARLKEAAH